jgi:methylthioribose-1-phosphate isomerase
MRHELLQALAKVERADPKMGRLMRRCISETAKSRPTARQLLKAIKAVQAQSKPLVKAIAFRGRGWVAKKNVL